MRQACLLVLGIALVLGGGTAVSAAPLAECQTPALSKAIDDSAPDASPLFASSFAECTIYNFYACPTGSPEDPDYCPCSWVWCDDSGWTCGEFF